MHAPACGLRRNIRTRWTPKASLVGGSLAEAEILAISIRDFDEESGKKQGSRETEPSPWNLYASYSNHSDCMDLY